MNIHILGGGLLGRLSALALAKQGFQVALHDSGGREGAQSAAYVAAAMLAPMAEAVDATALVLALGRQSLPLWHDIVRTLPEPVFLQQNGSLMVWHGQDAALAQQFERHLQRAHAGQTVWQRWQAADIAAQEPQLGGRFQAAFYLPGEGQLDNRQTLLALAAALEQHGAACHWHSRADAASLQQADGWLLDCRGFGGKTSWNAAVGSRLRGVRGEVARVWAPEVALTRPVRLLHPRYPLYIAPKPNHVFVIGATQIEGEDDSPVSVRGGLELFSALYAVHPAFGEARLLETASGLRPTLNHDNPEIRYCPHRRTVAANGLFRHGFMIGPAVADALARLLCLLRNQQMPPPQDAVSGLAWQQWPTSQ